MSISDAIGKIAYAKKPVTVHMGSPLADRIYVVPPNYKIGEIDFWEYTDNGLYWQFRTQDGANNLYARSDKTKIDIKNFDDSQLRNYKNGQSFTSILVDRIIPDIKTSGTTVLDLNLDLPLLKVAFIGVSALLVAYLIGKF